MVSSTRKTTRRDDVGQLDWFQLHRATITPKIPSPCGQYPRESVQMVGPFAYLFLMATELPQSLIRVDIEVMYARVLVG